MAPSQPYQTIIPAIEEALPQPSHNTVIYVAGNGEMCQLLYKHLKNQLGWNGKQVRVKPFWMQGKKGLE
jgi:NADPH-dependent ferric siderophore reductase